MTWAATLYNLIILLVLLIITNIIVQKLHDAPPDIFKNGPVDLHVSLISACAL